MKSKATDASLPTNLLAVFGLYSLWRALCGKSRFDMPAGSGYKAAMELKSSMGMDVKPGDKAKCKWCGKPIIYKQNKANSPYWQHESSMDWLTCRNTNGYGKKTTPKK